MEREAAPSRDGTARPPRVLAVASHPIQYQAPWFRQLAQAPGIDFSVLFVRQLDASQQGAGFGVPFEWDVPLLDGYRWQVVPHLRGTPRPGHYFSARMAGTRSLLRSLAPDVILLTGWHTFAMVQILAAASAIGCPVIMRAEANALRHRPWYARWLHHALLSRCAAFLPIGKASRAYYESHGIEARRLFDAPYFVDNARFDAGAQRLAPQRQALRNQWSVAPDATCFCFAGKLEPKKRILDLLEALARALQSTTAPMHLLVVGDGAQMQQARAMAEAQSLPVTFAGFLNQTEIPSAYAACDCLVLPSDHGETWGLVVNEAMASGRPAITSDRVGCAADLVVEGQTGATFPFADTKALAALLADCANSPARLRDMGRAAKDHVFAGYTVERSVQGTLAAVRHVLESA